MKKRPSSKLFLLLSVFLLIDCKIVFSYDVPVGIPSPDKYFEGFDPMNAQAPVVNKNGTCDRCPGWPSSPTQGCYFVNKSDPKATDSDNPYGYPNRPRRTPPEGVLKAGDFVYFNGGVYTTSDSSGDRFDWAGIGTSSNPIWICGNPQNRPVIQDYIHVGGSHSTDYLILDNLLVNGTNRAHIELRPTSEGVTINHVVIRNCILTGIQDSKDGSGIVVGPTGGTPPSNTTVTNTVVFNNQISNFGDKQGTEQAGVYLGFNTDYTWVLKNEIHDVGADGVAGCHRANDTDKFARHYFIGDNKIYQNGENSIDLKAIQDYVISNNELYGPYTRENGWAIVLHYGQYSVGCSNGWVIFNKIHDAAGGVIITDNNERVAIIGNEIFNIYDNPSCPDPLNGVAVGFRGMDGACNIVNNTLYGYKKAGIRCNQGLDSSDSVVIENNIFSSKINSDAYEIRIDDGEDRVTVRNNQYYHEDGNAAFFWNDNERNLGYMKAIGKCTGGQEGDPRFVAPVSNFSLQTASPCIDRGIVSQVYAEFEAQYGFSIRKDAAGNTRPQGEGWDIGAFEYLEGAGNPGSPPPAPGNFRIQ